ncbi:ABC transporter ATP-binding protein, partial [Streptomyces sp. NBRC 110611]
MAEQTTGVAGQEQGNGVAAVPGGGRVPTVIADDLHIVYRVYGGGAGKG